MVDFVYPIVLDQPIWRSAPRPRERRQELTAADLDTDCFFLDSPRGTRVTVNATDGSDEGIRLTNLCGVRKGAILKLCPRCGLRKPSGDFGLLGREMNGRRRDQSHCNRCRG